MSNYKTRRAVYGVHFCGQEASNYGKKNGYLDYAAFARAFDAVQIDADALFQAEKLLGGWPEPIGSRPDYSDEIDEKREAAQDLTDDADNLEAEADDIDADADDADEENDEARAAQLRSQADEKRKEADEKREQAAKLEEAADDLENEQDRDPEIYQYFIVDNNGKDLIESYTDDPLFYLEKLDLYVWGVTHWGTSWDYVLTDIKLNACEEALS